VSLLLGQAHKEDTRFRETLDETQVARTAEEYYGRLTASLESDSEDWKALIPGRPLLGMLAAGARLPLSRAKTLYVNVGLESERQPFGEVIQIFQHFAESS